MYPRIVRLCGIALTALVALTGSVVSQTPQKSAKELITGNWTLMIADNVRSEGSNSPGFGPLPKGTARFDADGRYSLEVMPSTGSQPGISASGTYTLDEAGKTLTLKVEESSVSNWKGTTQNGTLKFVSSDHLGWTTSAPLVASADFTGTELIWARAK
jgi:hypothetical protein